MGWFDKSKKSGSADPFDSGFEPPPYNGSEGGDVAVGENENADGLHRRLKNRQIQLLAIGGSIGTALFVSIGTGLQHAGPANLLIAFIIQSCMLALVNNCIAEMTVTYPVSGGFVRLAGKWVDDAFGFMAGWNFFFYEAFLIPFEITALHTVLTFWRDDIPVWAVCIACVILYAAINILAVKAFGEAEFWLSGGKVILIFMLFAFTFITMVGGNPQNDVYGFRNWEDPPGAFRAYLDDGALGRFEGFLAALYGTAAFTVVGPEYISMVAAEAMRPRKYIKTAFKTVYWRFGIFFIGGALAVGIILPWNDPTLDNVVNGSSDASGTAAASPYVIAMRNLNVQVFPHIVNALLVTSIFSAGNTYTYCATRTLYGLALEGRAPKPLRFCTRNGVPLFCFVITMIFPFLSFLQVGNDAAQVLTWLVNLVTAGGLIDYIIMCVTYIFFYRACKVQGVDRNEFKYTGYFQPYGAWIALIWLLHVVLCFGYTSFYPWNINSFFSTYVMVGVAPILFIFWKVIKRTKFVKPHEADLVWDRPVIDAYEETFYGPPSSFWKEMLNVFTFGLLGKQPEADQRSASIDAGASSPSRTDPEK
ncbi:putative amino acid permease [Hortaea werneckii]|uniref:Amino acid permease/ SLC12A domain-containing protein n=1 Tax=Hortaea werneckii EXF-2000 TaxID=1157616 RepID=A0A1Z5T888_HORWE|nr:putative amino acid permease [Hortaea werneckii]OTA32249.1 hypothetical protein BTJ68_07640 [Hortaea werneckii EXF-2000]KAI6819626.1 putative amino acid permease [Hortaea werneckii]KAI6883885.1 putative amino acid permease [Hortaea werneckii]KAI6992961.1 putative amino acid permease [Hortaea werneckii]